MRCAGAAARPRVLTVRACAQAYVLEFGSLSSYLWTGCFAFHLYLLICNRKAEPGRFEKYYHIVSWGLPLLCVGYLLARQLGGHTEVGNADRPWCVARSLLPPVVADLRIACARLDRCWIRDRTGNNEHWNRGVIEQFAMYYLPLTLVMVWNLVLYCLLSRSMHDYRMRRVIKRRLLLYLVIFLLCAVWGLVHRVYQVRHWHSCMHGIAAMGVGMLTAADAADAAVLG